MNSKVLVLSLLLSVSTIIFAEDNAQVDVVETTQKQVTVVAKTDETSSVQESEDKKSVIVKEVSTETAAE